MAEDPIKLSGLPYVTADDLDDNDLIAVVRMPAEDDEDGEPSSAVITVEEARDALAPEIDIDWDEIDEVPANVAALGELTGAADRLPYFTALATLALAVFTSFGRSLAALADLNALKTLLGLGSAAYVATDTFAAASHNHDASTITTGVLDPARIPVLFSGVQVVSSGGIAALDAGQQTTVTAGAIVTTTDGRRWVYTGSGSKTSEASYIECADVTPDWTVVANKPSGLDALAARLTASASAPLLTIDTAAMNGSNPGVVCRYRRSTGDVVNWLVDDYGLSINTTYGQFYVAIITGSLSFGDGNTQIVKVADGHVKVSDVSGNPAKLSLSQLTLAIATGTAPLVVSSTTVCANLNADSVDGAHVGDGGGNLITWSGPTTYPSGSGANITGVDAATLGGSTLSTIMAAIAAAQAAADAAATAAATAQSTADTASTAASGAATAAATAQATADGAASTASGASSTAGSAATAAAAAQATADSANTTAVAAASAASAAQATADSKLSGNGISGTFTTTYVSNGLVTGGT
jgi:hypothetical protein